MDIEQVKHIEERLLFVCGIQEGDEDYDDSSIAICEDGEVWYGLTLIVEDINNI